MTSQASTPTELLEPVRRDRFDMATAVKLHAADAR